MEVKLDWNQMMVLGVFDCLSVAVFSDQTWQQVYLLTTNEGPVLPLLKIGCHKCLNKQHLEAV